MASSNSVQHQTGQQNYQQTNTTYQCKDCGLYFNSASSLDVHVQYHKENLLNKWATQAQAGASHSEETNNNNTKVNTIKREFISSSTVSAADSSDSMTKKSPEYGNRTTPETNMFGHPPTPQSYHSASSPYQNNDNSVFSTNFQNFQQIKVEPTSPVSHYQTYPNYPDSQFYQMDPNQQYSQDYSIHKPFRYHPYQQSQVSPYERPQSQVSSSSPVYPPQPTPSPSPKQCDKCGYVCDSASQLIEHLNLAHPPTPAPHLANYQNFLFGAEHQQPPMKSEDDAQSEILDLDSHKVHQVYPEEEKRQNGDVNGPNPHSVTAMLNSWPPNHQVQQQQVQHQKMFPQEQHGKMFQAEQKIFQPHQIHGQDYLGNGVPTSSQESVGNGINPMIQQPPQAYRPFEHLPAQPNPPVITSTQVPTNAAPVSGPTSTKSANWKSNEARRPKTYNCTACNKWFTSSGHLKRHYNTTLHKNAVKSSGHPDPASLPISAHHHPARDSSSRDDSSGSPEPAPNIVHQAPPLHSPMGHAASPLGTPLVNPSNLTNVANGSSPNGEAGPSPTNLDSRGLLLNSTPNSMGNVPVHGFNMASPMMPMENSQFQMYPNELAPHVTQAMVINSLSTTGESQYTLTDLQQPLPSFAQLQLQRMGLVVGYSDANVGGGGTATSPYIPVYSDNYELAEVRSLVSREEEHYNSLNKYGSFQPAEANSCPEEFILPFAPSPSNNNNNSSIEESFVISECENKIHTMDDVKSELDLESRSPPDESPRYKSDYEDNVSAPVVSSTAHIKTLGIHKCYECDKVFNKACYLTQHNKTFHSGDKPFKCTRCGKRFSNESVYREHHSKHAGDKPHKCDLCPKQFNHKTDLRRHMCLHTGQKPYSCETCGKGFIRKDHMLKHCETHLRKAQPKIRS